MVCVLVSRHNFEPEDVFDGAGEAQQIVTVFTLGRVHSLIKRTGQ